VHSRRRERNCAPPTAQPQHSALRQCTRRGARLLIAEDVQHKGHGRRMGQKCWPVKHSASLMSCVVSSHYLAPRMACQHVNSDLIRVTNSRFAGVSDDHNHKHDMRNLKAQVPI
jgi:hypothetical protein